jgi:hypothetical protein
LNKIIRLSVRADDAEGADYVNEQHTPDSRRGRFIAPSADLSALSGRSAIRMILLNFIIGPQWMFRYLKWFCEKS